MSLFYKTLCYFLAAFFSMMSWLVGLFPSGDNGGFRVSAYLAADSAAAVENMDVSHLKDVTDIILTGAPASFDADGNVLLGDGFDEIMDAVTEKTRGTGVAVHLELAGPGAAAEQYKQAFRGGALKENIKNVLYNYPLNGVFFDCGYPLTDRIRREFGAFLVSLKEILGDHYLLGCALSPRCAALPRDALRALDRVELTCRDLRDPAAQAISSYSAVKKAALDMILRGCRPEQIDVGLPFYALPASDEDVRYDYKDYYDRLDKSGMLPDGEGGVAASFNTPDMVFVRTKFALRWKLGGVTVRDYSCDVPADNEASLFGAIIRAKGEAAPEEEFPEDKMSGYEYDRTLVSCVPSERQLLHARTEFYAFFHFGVNTFTDSEWGDGTESPSIFDPTEFDASQWVDIAAAAGMKGVILTAKHHDGFCLWPSRYTEHSVKNSPFRNGNGDVVREVADACRAKGLKFGVYLSPWDRHEPTYGQGRAYDDYFCNQLTELLTGYGEIFSVWFDGACGEDPNGKVQSYDWDRYYAVVRRYQPNACMAVSGPDVRWCGNEAGQTRESEWSVLPTSFFTPEEVAAHSQQEDSAEFRQKSVDLMGRDLGSRDFLKGARGLHWYPSETDTSIRPGWFYHASEDRSVRSTKDLKELWYRTVGGNSSLLLNIPPDRRGLIGKPDEKNLRELGAYLRKTFSRNFAEGAVFTADTDDGVHTAGALAADTYDDYYKTEDGDTTAEITVGLAGREKVSHVVIKEHIPMSQRVERFAVDVRLADGTWRKVAEGTTVGYQKIVKFNPVRTDAVRVRILDSRVCPVLSFIGVY